MFIRGRSRWLSMLVVAALLVSTVLLRPGFSAASTNTPVISPNGGTFTAAKSVTISNIPSGDQTYYTTDGTNPTYSITRVLYSGAFTVSQSETVKAVNLDSVSGYSNITSAAFVISSSSTVPAPVIYPNGGTYTTQLSVTLSNIPSGDQAYYTLNGSDPTTNGTLYNGSFTVSQSEKVKAVNRDANNNWSTVTSAAFVISGSSTVPAPVIYPNGGTYSSALNVTLSNIPSGYTAYYTLDGSDPITNGTLYKGGFTVSQSETVKAVNQDANNDWSTVTTAAFVISGTGPNHNDNSSYTIDQLKQQLQTAIDNNDWLQAQSLLKEIIKTEKTVDRGWQGQQRGRGHYKNDDGQQGENED